MPSEVEEAVQEFEWSENKEGFEKIVERSNIQGRPWRKYLRRRSTLKV